MKRIFFVSLLILQCVVVLSQISVSKKQGSSVITKLSMGVKVNEDSSLLREQITINDAGSPIQLNEIGIETSYSSPVSSPES